MKPDATILDKLLEVGQLFQFDMERAFAGTGLTVARTHLLWVLAANRASTQQVLAEALGVSPRNITGLVDALERSGHVRRDPHPTDRRAVLVVLSELGQSTMETMAQEHQDLAHQLQSSIRPEDLQPFERGLDAALATLRRLVAEAAKTAEPAEHYNAAEPAEIAEPAATAATSKATHAAATQPSQTNDHTEDAPARLRDREGQA